MVKIRHSILRSLSLNNWTLFETKLHIIFVDVEEEEEMGFIGRTKRTIWMGSPSLHPTYSNFYIHVHIYVHIHIGRIIICILVETIRHMAV